MPLWTAADHRMALDNVLCDACRHVAVITTACAACRTVYHKKVGLSDKQEDEMGDEQESWLSDEQEDADEEFVRLAACEVCEKWRRLGEGQRVSARDPFSCRDVLKDCDVEEVYPIPPAPCESVSLSVQRANTADMTYLHNLPS